MIFISVLSRIWKENYIVYNFWIETKRFCLGWYFTLCLEWYITFCLEWILHFFWNGFYTGFVKDLKGEWFIPKGDYVLIWI